MVLKSNMGWEGLAAPDGVDRDTTASSLAANVSSIAVAVAVAEVLPLDPDNGVAITVVVLDAYAREPKNVKSV